MVTYFCHFLSPNIFEDISAFLETIFYFFLQKFLYEKLRKFGAEVKTFGLEASEIVSEELMRRFELAEKSLMADLRPVLNYFETEHESFNRDLGRYMRNFNEHYKKNNFYLQTIKVWLSRVWNDIWIEYKMMAYNFQIKMNEFNEYLSKILEESSRDFDRIYGKANALLTVSVFTNNLDLIINNLANFKLTMFC